jgi:hypothetical protein
MNDRYVVPSLEGHLVPFAVVQVVCNYDVIRSGNGQKETSRLSVDVQRNLKVSSLHVATIQYSIKSNIKQSNIKHLTLYIYLGINTQGSHSSQPFA